MRVILLLFLLIACSAGNTTPNDTIDIETFRIIGDSIFLKNGITCHIDSFTNGNVK